MSGRRAVYLTFRRELRERARSRAFLISTGIQLLFVVGILVISIVSSDDEADSVRLGVVGAEAREVGELARTERGSLEVRLELRDLDSAAAARAAIDDDGVDLAIAGRQLLTGPDPDDRAVELVQGAWQAAETTSRLRESGLSPPQIERALDPPTLATEQVGGDEGGQGLAFAGSLLLYIALLTFGYTVTSGVVEEKSSRVIEVILSAIRPIHLLTGKVAGIGLAGLLQLVVVSGTGLSVALATGQVDLPSSTPTTLAAVIVYFVLGYLFYACAFAVAGSTVSRQEDTQNTTSPLLVILVAGYIASTTIIEEPDGSLAQIMTFLPPVAPLVVPIRAAQDTIAPWELALSVLFMVAGTLLLIRLAARIYERSVLRMGAPLGVAEMLRLAR